MTQTHYDREVIFLNERIDKLEKIRQFAEREIDVLKMRLELLRLEFHEQQP